MRSFRQRPESSGLCNSFPQSGNDDRTRHPIKSAIPSPSGLPSSAACSRRGSTTYVPVGVDSSFRWNDDEERTGGLPSRQLLCRSGKSQKSPLTSFRRRPESSPPSFRRRPESSGLDYRFPRSGNDNSIRQARTGKSRRAYKHPASACSGFLGGLFPTPLYHLRPCRRAFAGRLRASCPLAAYRTSCP